PIAEDWRESSGAISSSVRPAIAYRMAEIADAHRVSTLGAEAAAAVEHLGAGLCVWEGDAGPGIRNAVTAPGAHYQTGTR
nr:hypothetical protein [Actinomycetota bacterium]